MPKYRKKPVVVEARGPLNADNLDELIKWCGGCWIALSSGGHRPDLKETYKLRDGAWFVPCLEIVTPEGRMTAIDGDYIIKGVKGEFYPCKPDIFEETYEPMDRQEGRDE